MREKQNSNLNGNIELLRILLGYVVAIEHFSFRIPGGIPIVDTFFLIAGFYQMRRMSRDRSFSPFRYILNRFTGIAFLYELSILLTCFFAEEGIGLKSFVGNLYRSLPDMFCLQMSGFFTVHINPPLWYLSAMMIASFVLALLFSYSSRLFHHALPVIVMLCYACLFYFQGNMDAIYYPNFAYQKLYLIPLGTLRAIGGLGLGAMLFLLYNRYQPQFCQKKARTILSIADLFALMVILYGVAFNHHNAYDFYYLLMLPVVLICVISQNTVWGRVSNRVGIALSSVLGKQYPLAVYCFHVLASSVFHLLFRDDSFGPGMTILVFFVILSLISFCFSKLSDRFYAAVKAKSSPTA